MEKALELIDKSTDELLILQKNLVALPALGPTNGGDGEKVKTDWLCAYLAQFPGISVETVQAPDQRVSCGYRPSLVIRRR